jgi:hypothetical protein
VDVDPFRLSVRFSVTRYRNLENNKTKESRERNKKLSNEERNKVWPDGVMCSEKFAPRIVLSH